MERDFNWLWENLKEGARDKFEEICYEVYSNKYPDDDVHRVRVTQGDGGIDVYIDQQSGDYTIVQCKYFLNEIGDSQKKQIRDSFGVAMKNYEDELTEWILCVPLTLSEKEHEWWKKWKKKNEKEFSISIRLHDSSKLMRLMKKHNFYDEYFNTVRIDRDFVEDVISKDEKTQIHNRIYPVVSSLMGVDYYIPWVISTVDGLMDLRAHRLFKNNRLLEFLEDLTTLYAFHAEGNRVRDVEMEKKELVLRKEIVEEYTKLNFEC